MASHLGRHSSKNIRELFAGCGAATGFLRALYCQFIDHLGNVRDLGGQLYSVSTLIEANPSKPDFGFGTEWNRMRFFDERKCLCPAIGL